MPVLEPVLPAFDAASAAETSGSTGSTAVPVTWSGTQPTKGATVFVLMQWKGTSTISGGVADNGTTVTTLTLDKSETFGTGSTLHTLVLYRGNNITLPASGNYIVTVNFSGTLISLGGGGVTALGCQAGGPVASNVSTAASSTAPTTGAATGTGAGNLYVMGFGTNSSITETISYTGPGAVRVSNNLGATQVFGLATFAGTGSQTGTWTTGDSVTYNGLIAVYPGFMVPQVNTVQSVCRASLF